MAILKKNKSSFFQNFKYGFNIFNSFKLKILNLYHFTLEVIFISYEHFTVDLITATSLKQQNQGISAVNSESVVLVFLTFASTSYENNFSHNCKTWQFEFTNVSEKKTQSITMSS